MSTTCLELVLEHSLRGSIWDKLLKSRSGFLYTRGILNQRDLQKQIQGHSQSVCLEKHPPRESLNASDFYKDKHFGCALGFVFVNPSDSEFPLCKENHCGFSTVCPIFSLSGYVQFQQEARRRLPPVAPDRRPHLLRTPV